MAKFILLQMLQMDGLNIAANSSYNFFFFFLASFTFIILLVFYRNHMRF